MGVLHDLNLLYKLDVEVLGMNNTFERMHIASETVSPPRWRNVPDNWVQRKLLREYVQNEDNATVFYKIDEPEYWLFVNRDAPPNRWESERAYRLSVGGLIYASTTARGNPATNPVQWQKYHLIVTKQKDSEMFGSSIYEQVEAADPYVNLLEYVDGEDIYQQDIVAWVNTGLHHIPHSEEAPTMQTPGASTSIYFRPFNFFDEDPSMDLLNAAYITPEGGQIDFGVLKLDCSYRPDVPLFQGDDIVVE